MKHLAYLDLWDQCEEEAAVPEKERAYEGGGFG